MLRRFEFGIFCLDLCIYLKSPLSCGVIHVSTWLTFRNDGGTATPLGTEKQRPIKPS